MYLVLHVYRKHYFLFFCIIGRFQVMIAQKFQRWLYVFLIPQYIVTIVLSVAWQFYRYMEMIDVFIDDNVLKNDIFSYYFYYKHIFQRCVSQKIERWLTYFLFLFVKVTLWKYVLIKIFKFPDVTPNQLKEPRIGSTSMLR